MVKSLKERCDDIVKSVLEIIKIGGVTDDNADQIKKLAYAIIEDVSNLHEIIKLLTKCKNPRFEVTENGFSLYLDKDSETNEKGGQNA